MNEQEIYEFMERMHSAVKCPYHPDEPLELVAFAGEYIIQCSHAVKTRHFGEKKCNWHKHTCNLDTQDAIGSYAYSLYEQRGHKHGHDLDDWLRAEGEVLPRMGT